MKSRRLSSRVLWAVVLFLQTACYLYVPSTTGSVPKVGQRAQLTLSTEGMTELARYLGPRVGMAEGTVTSVAEDGAITMAVDMVQLSTGLKQPWTGEGVVAFPRAYVVDVKERTYQRRRSIVFGAALGVGLVTVAIIALRSAGAFGGSTDGGSPPP